MRIERRAACVPYSPEERREGREGGSDSLRRRPVIKLGTLTELGDAAGRDVLVEEAAAPAKVTLAEEPKERADLARKGGTRDRKGQATSWQRAACDEDARDAPVSCTWGGARPAAARARRAHTGGDGRGRQSALPVLRQPGPRGPTWHLAPYTQRSSGVAALTFFSHERHFSVL
jgi:hypothetical protein